MLTGASVFSFFGFVVSQLFLGIPLLTDPNLLDNARDPELLPALRTMQVLQAFGLLIVPSVLYLWIADSWDGIKQLFQSPVRQSVMISIVFFMVALPFVNFLAEWNMSWEIPTFVGEWIGGKEDQIGTLTELFLDMPHAGLLVFNLIMIALLPAVGEELIFRGIMQRGLQERINPHVAIWLIAALFSAIHMQFLGFMPRLLMGVAMGYLLLWSGNLWYPIIAHFTNNALAVIFAYGIQHNAIDAGLEQSGTDNATVAAFSLIFCLMLLYLFKQHQEAGSTKG